MVVKNKTVLIAEDDMSIKELLSEYLSDNGFSVLTALDGAEAINVFEKNKNEIDIVLMDWMMPEIDGFRCFEYIKEKTNIPVIFLTAKTDDVTQVQAIDAGAADFIKKPFSLPVVLSRISSRLNARDPEVVIHKNFRIDKEKRCCYVNEDKIDLSKKEYSILLYLTNNIGIAIQKKALHEEVWGNSSSSKDATLHTHIKELRQKMQGAQVNIKTVWGYGYILE